MAQTVEKKAPSEAKELEVKLNPNTELDNLHKKETENMRYFRCTVTHLDLDDSCKDRTVHVNANGIPYKFQENEEVVLSEAAIAGLNDAVYTDYRRKTGANGATTLEPYTKKRYAVSKGDEVK